MPETLIPIGEAVVCDIDRREDDSDDINVHLSDATQPDGNAVVIGWLAQLDISTEKGGAPVAGGTFTGTGIAGGNIPIDMNGFAIQPVANYFFDIRITDTVTGDTPARVYFTGKFKLKDRIKTP